MNGLFPDRSNGEVSPDRASLRQLGMPNAPEPDRRKVRAGLALITLAFVVALVGALIAGNAIVRLVFAALALLTIVRVARLARSLRRPPER